MPRAAALWPSRPCRVLALHGRRARAARTYFAAARSIFAAIAAPL